MNKILQIAIEAVVVGIVFLVLAFVVESGLSWMMPSSDVKYPVLFLAGALGHVIFEIMGTNEWYCLNRLAK